jgi:hypothetical protein
MWTIHSNNHFLTNLVKKWQDLRSSLLCQFLCSSSREVVVLISSFSLSSPLVSHSPKAGGGMVSATPHLHPGQDPRAGMDAMVKNKYRHIPGIESRFSGCPACCIATLLTELHRQVGVAVTVQSSMRDVLVWYLGRDTCYPDWGFLVAFLTLCRKIPAQYLDLATTTSFQFLPNSSIILQFHAIPPRYWQHHKINHKKVIPVLY